MSRHARDPEDIERDLIEREIKERERLDRIEMEKMRLLERLESDPEKKIGSPTAIEARATGLANLNRRGRPKGAKNKRKKATKRPKPKGTLSPEEFLSETSGLEFMRLAQEFFAPPMSLSDFFAKTSPFTPEPWQVHLCDRLQKLIGQKGQRILLHKPPQRGGSIITSQRFPAYALGRDPMLRFRHVTHNQTHSEMFSDVIQGIMRTKEYHEIFPNTKLPKQTNMAEWSTPQREAQLDGQPSYMALGLQGAVVGVGGDIWCIDDPYATFEDAKSPVVNQKIQDWHRNILIPRLAPEANLIVMFHRFHPDDYAGWLMQQEEEWEVIRYADICDSEDDPIGRQLGEALSSRYPIEYLEKQRARDPLVFEGLHQGKPNLPDGNAIKRTWFDCVDEFNPKMQRASSIYFDLGGSSSVNADRTVGTWGSKFMDDSFMWWWQIAGQWDPATRDTEIERFCLVVNSIQRGIPIHLEAGIGLGVDSVTKLRNRLLASGLNVKFDRVTQSKWERATNQVDSFMGCAEARRIKFYSGNYYRQYGLYDGKTRWIEPYLTEVSRLQVKQTDRGIELVGGKDDRFDSGVGLMNKLTSKRASLSLDERQALNRLFQ